MDIIAAAWEYLDNGEINKAKRVLADAVLTAEDALLFKVEEITREILTIEVIWKLKREKPEDYKALLTHLKNQRD